MSKELTKESISEFKKLKKWVTECPVEATMKIQDLDEVLSMQSDEVMNQAYKIGDLKQQNKHYNKVITRIVNYIETTEDEMHRQLHKIHVVLDNVLEDES